MEFALQYEIQRSRPHYPGFMYDIYQQATEQVKLADRLGYHSVWTVEHHFLNEWSYSSAPEVWYGALSQVTSRIRLGHGICLLPIPFNHPVRVAERIAVLDIMSNGRVEFGSGRSITEQELGGFQVNPEDSRAMWEEAVAAIPKMWMQETFSHDGKFFKMPEREVIPKPIQKPHPPMWVAATQPSTWEIAGQKGIGALGFGISEPGMLDKLIADVQESDQRLASRSAHSSTIAPPRPPSAYAHRRARKPSVIAKDAIDFTTRKAAELFTPFAKQEVKGYEYYKKMAEQAVALGDYRLSTGRSRQANRSRRRDGRRSGRLPEGREDLRISRRRFAADAGAGRRRPARKGDADDRSDRQARNAKAQPKLKSLPGRISRRPLNWQYVREAGAVESTARSLRAGENTF